MIITLASRDLCHQEGRTSVKRRTVIPVTDKDTGIRLKRAKTFHFNETAAGQVQGTRAPKTRRSSTKFDQDDPAVVALTMPGCDYSKRRRKHT